MQADEEILEIFRAELGEQVEALAANLDRPPSEWDVHGLFRLAHNVKGAARMVGARTVNDTAHALEDLFSAVRSGVLPPADEAATLAAEGLVMLEAARTSLGGPAPPGLDGWRKRVSVAVSANPRPPAVAPAAAAAPPPASAEPPAVQAPAEAPSRPDESAHASGDMLRIPARRLDSLLGLAADLVASASRGEARAALAGNIVAALSALQARHPELASFDGAPELLELCHELRRDAVLEEARTRQLVEQLQEGIRALRMVRIDTLAGAMRRVLREASETTGKPVELVVPNTDAEVDRAVLERLRDPLVHLVRNAVAHGIEAPDARAAAGKPRLGRISLSATSGASGVEVTLSDDGRGIDADAIRAAAVAKGLLPADAARALDASACLDLLFLPGFSTALRVSELAGRGVGLDVVRRNVTELGGRVHVRSALGSGTSFVLRVPLTRLTTRGVLFRLGDQRFAVPTHAMERVLDVRPGAIQRVEGGNVVHTPNGLVRATSLASLLGMRAVPQGRQAAIVLSVHTERHAVLVDEVLGEREFLLQQLGAASAYGLAGGALIDGDDVVIVLDAAALIEECGGRGTDALVATASAERQRSVLVVDDSVTSRTLVRNLLASAGYAVAVSVDGRDALSRLEAERFDLVVTDVEMPYVDGFELTRAIRAHPTLRPTPVVLVTSLGNESHKARGAEAGANAYIVKGTFDQDELLRTVARLF